MGFLREFFAWYNGEHYRCVIGWLTPASVHYGEAQEILRKARRCCTESGALRTWGTQPPSLPTMVWINPPPRDDSAVALLAKLMREVSQSP